MSASRFAILEWLSEQTDPDGNETTSIEAIASNVDLEESEVETQLEWLACSELVSYTSGGTIRITITGRQFLDLDIDDMVIIEPTASDSDE